MLESIPVCRYAHTTIFRMREIGGWHGMTGRQTEGLAKLHWRQTGRHIDRVCIMSHLMDAFTKASSSSGCSAFSMGGYWTTKAWHAGAIKLQNHWLTERRVGRENRQTDSQKGREAGCLTAAWLLTPSCFPARSAWQKINDAALSWRRTVTIEKGGNDTASPNMLNSCLYLFSYTGRFMLGQEQDHGDCDDDVNVTECVKGVA